MVQVKDQQSDKADAVVDALRRIEDGDPTASSDLLPLVYRELRELAASRLAKEPAAQTLQPTALVHEVYLRLTKHGDVQKWNSRGHFFGAASTAMRRILIEQARRKKIDTRRRRSRPNSQHRCRGGNHSVFGGTARFASGFGEACKDFSAKSKAG